MLISYIVDACTVLSYYNMFTSYMLVFYGSGFTPNILITYNVDGYIIIVSYNAVFTADDFVSLSGMSPQDLLVSYSSIQFCILLLSMYCLH